MCNVIALNADDDPTHRGGISQLQLFKSRLDDGAWVVSCPEQPRVLAQFRDRTQPADFKEVCRVTVTYPPPAAQSSEPSYTRLTSQTPTGQHDIAELHLAIMKCTGLRALR